MLASFARGELQTKSLGNWPLFVRIVLICFALLATTIAAQSEPLASWRDGPAKARIVAFVASVTTKGPQYIVPEDRIAVFDNDGTLWAEQPIYFQLRFAIDQVKALAPQRPEWRVQQPFKAALNGDMKALAAAGEKGLARILVATHTGMTTERFASTVTNWLASAKHPRCNCPYTDLVYQPMLELMAYLRANGFKTYIVSGGTVEFMRAFAQTVYGVPPEQVIGSSFVTRFDGRGAKPVIVREGKIEFIDDGPGKPVAIDKFIGRRPVFAFGNSDGDQQMLQWIMAGTGARFAGLVHHTDAEREWAYDRASHVGKLDKALDEAAAKGWLVVDMKKDWERVFPRVALLSQAIQSRTR